MNGESTGSKWRVKTGTHRGLCLLLHNHMRTVFWILMQALALYLILFVTAGEVWKGHGEYIFPFKKTITEQRQVFFFANALMSVPGKKEMINKKPCFCCWKILKTQNPFQKFRRFMCVSTRGPRGDFIIWAVAPETFLVTLPFLLTINFWELAKLTATTESKVT